VKRKRYLLEKIKQAEEEEARLAVEESAASMKMQENELREDAIRSALLKQLTTIDHPTPRVLQTNGMSAGSAPIAPIVTATIVDDNSGSNGFVINDCLQQLSPCDSNGLIDPSNQGVPAPKILSPPADALPQRQRNNRASRSNSAESLGKRKVQFRSTVEVVNADASECDTSGEDSDLQTAADRAASEAAAIARARFVYIQKLKIRGDSGRRRWDKKLMQAECTRLGINYTSKHLLKIAERLAAAATK
jgi:hypothetical protein